MHDLVIRGAEVADGSGAPLRMADVAVSDGRITEVGRVGGAAKQSVDGSGLVLSPGIVDVHTHYDAQLTWDSNATPSPALGVTTVVVGNCGFSIAPCPPECRDLIARNLAEVEGMSLTALRSGTNWEFESFAEYLTLLKRKGVTPNVAAFIGHSAVRTMVMGDEASARAANDDEVAAMRDLVAGGMDAGAVGFSTSTSINHYGDGGVPMPSRLAEESELHSLVGVLGEKKRGVFQLTVGLDEDPAAAIHHEVWHRPGPERQDGKSRRPGLRRRNHEGILVGRQREDIGPKEFPPDVCPG